MVSGAGRGPRGSYKRGRITSLYNLSDSSLFLRQ